MTTKAQILKAIRQYCIGCSGNARDDIKRCTITNCELYPFRMGKDPHPARKGPKHFPVQKVKSESEVKK